MSKPLGHGVQQLLYIQKKVADPKGPMQSFQSSLWEGIVLGGPTWVRLGL